MFELENCINLKDLIEVLKKWGAKPVTPMEVYTDIFHLGEGLIQSKNEAPGEYKANPIAIFKNHDDQYAHIRILFEDEFAGILKELQQADFAIVNGITYFGKHNTMAHASKLYAIIFDIDGINKEKLNNLLSGAMLAGVYPIPNYIILSGHGIHLYYVMEQPIPLYPNIKLQLKNFKYELTEKLWNRYTSTEKKKQIQGLNQGFRVIGGRTKDDALIKYTQAYQLNTHPYSLEQLNEYVMDNKVDATKIFKETKMTLAQARKKWPEWYQRIVVEKGPRKKWDIAGKVHGDDPYALYHWWLHNIHNGASYGHRYFCIMALTIYAIKCDVPLEQLKADAYALQPMLNDINPAEPFTVNDINSALECFDLKYSTFPIRDIEKISGITIKRNRRNGRTRAAHIKLMNYIRDEINNNKDWRNKKGRPKNIGNKGKVVKEWKEQHPTGSKSDCAKELGISRTTVHKWWDAKLTFAQMFGKSKKESLAEIRKFYREHGYKED